MDILLMEDNPAKKGKLLPCLHSQAEGGRVDAVLCAEDALRLLKERQYDLFVADLVIPWRCNAEEKESNAIEIFQKIDEEIGGVFRPKFSLTISAGQSLSLEAQEFFGGRPWGIVRYDESSDECIEAIVQTCKFVKNEIQATSKSNRTCDVAIICALLEPEFAAIENLDLKWEAFEPLDGMQLIRYGQFHLNGKIIRVAAAFCSKMGPVPTAVLTTKIITALQPKVLLMSGICAGIPGKAAIGDVIAADVSWDWQSGKYIDKSGVETFEIAPHQVNIDGAVKNIVLMFKRDRAFWDSLAIMSSKKNLNIPKLILGPMASGSSVLADERVVSRIKSTQHKNVTGLDMEVYAMYAAAEACGSSTKFIAFKAVCDNGDVKKSDDFQTYASEISAAAVFHFIKFHAAPLLN